MARIAGEARKSTALAELAEAQAEPARAIGLETAFRRRGRMKHLVTQDRAGSVQHALRLEYLTVGWNIVEGIVAVSAAVLAGSIALLGFGIDSFVESASGAILIWRLSAERRGTEPEEVERLDARAHKLVGASLFLLAAYIAIDAVTALWNREAPRPTATGIALTLVSIVAMRWLARAKRRAAASLGSRALEADAFQTTACFWLSIVTLGGIGLNAALGWWWADPAAALGMTWFIAREGTEAWRGEDCDCSGAKEHVGCANASADSGARAARGDD
jgi:divalent metal cation (Fe/Co/Zn/Cd) transporter